jgi:hypothetical protein
MIQRIKYDRTPHLPWSEGVNADDEVRNWPDFMDELCPGNEVVVTEKRDGECTTLYPDNYVHARSIDGSGHPWQDWVKGMWSERSYNLPEGWRVCGENTYAKHSIAYDSLPSFFEVFRIYDQQDSALSWDDTVLWCQLLDLHTVPVIWRGMWEDFEKEKLWPRLQRDVELGLRPSLEGYVASVAHAFPRAAFGRCVGKFVRANHVQTDRHWRETWTPNSMK